MIRYCSKCGRSIPIDSRVCPYCGKPIEQHDLTIMSQPEQKKDDKIVLIVVVVVLLLLVVPIAISAAVYVYVTGMVGSINTHSYESTPSMYLLRNTTEKTLTVTYVYFSSSVPWDDIEIQGTCNTSMLGGYVTEGDTITECSGKITMIYIPTNSKIDDWTFSEN